MEEKHQPDSNGVLGEDQSVAQGENALFQPIYNTSQQTAELTNLQANKQQSWTHFRNWLE